MLHLPIFYRYALLRNMGFCTKTPLFIKILPRFMICGLIYIKNVYPTLNDHLYSLLNWKIMRTFAKNGACHKVL